MGASACHCAAAVGHFKEAALEKIRLEADAASQREAVESERAANEDEKAEVTRTDAANFSVLNEALDRLASGDLTHRITAQFSPKAESLKTNFNTAAETYDAVVIASLAAQLAGSNEATPDSSNS